MRIVFRLILPALACLLSLCAILFPSRSTQKTSSLPAAAQSAQPTLPNDSTKPLRLNTLGVAYLNQQRSADAQKLFEQALQADPKFAVARLNLGIALLNQQKAEAARDELLTAAQQLPRDPYAWYNLGLASKDLAAFSHGVAAFEKGLALFPYHASSEFGIARAYQRKGDSASAREHLAKFQNITTNHLGAPFGAGYGDPGRLSLAELPAHSSLAVPPAIPVHFTAQNVETLLQNSTKSPSSTPGPST